LEPLTNRRSPSGNGPSGGSLGDMLLATKLYAPPVRPNLVARPRLIHRIDEGTKGMLTLISAPAGFGKSTLLGEWLLHGRLPVGWLSLEEEDNDPVRFLSYLIAALRKVRGSAGEGVLSLLRPPQAPPVKAVMTALINEVAAFPEDFALILDDYHVIENGSVHAGIAFLVEHLPPRMHLIIASRTEPPLPLSRLRVRGHVSELDAADLQFTPEASAAFLNDTMGLDLSADDVAVLEERTEGWIAGLQLAALSVRGRENASDFISAFAGSNRRVFDYLAEEVLDSSRRRSRGSCLRPPSSSG
jgi:LuxR family maltose regulon positive regulatory protein